MLPTVSSSRKGLSKCCTAQDAWLCPWAAGAWVIGLSVQDCDRESVWWVLALKPPEQSPSSQLEIGRILCVGWRNLKISYNLLCQLTRTRSDRVSTRGPSTPQIWFCHRVCRKLPDCPDVSECVMGPIIWRLDERWCKKVYVISHLQVPYVPEWLDPDVYKQALMPSSHLWSHSSRKHPGVC